MSDWKTLSSQIVHKNPWFSVKEDKIVRKDGKKQVYYVIDRSPCVIIVPLTDKNEVWLIHLARYTTQALHWEIPIGSTDNQDELIAAKRELQEETGLVSDSWLKLAELEVANGMTSQMSHIFVAQDVKETQVNKQAEEGIDQTQKVPFNKAIQMIKMGEIIDTHSIAGIMLAGLKLNLL